MQCLTASASASAAAGDAGAAATDTAAEVEAADEARLRDGALGLLSLFALEYAETKVSAALGTSTEAVAAFLGAVGAGADARAAELLREANAVGKTAAHASVAEGRASAWPHALVPLTMETYMLATQLRMHLMGQFDVLETCALLRLIARHGRIHPGPPSLGGTGSVVNSEKKQTTHSAEVPPEVASLMH